MMSKISHNFSSGRKKKALTEADRDQIEIAKSVLATARTGLEKRGEMSTSSSQSGGDNSVDLVGVQASEVALLSEVSKTSSSADDHVLLPKIKAASGMDGSSRGNRNSHRREKQQKPLPTRVTVRQETPPTTTNTPRQKPVRAMTEGETPQISVSSAALSAVTAMSPGLAAAAASGFSSLTSVVSSQITDKEHVMATGFKVGGILGHVFAACTAAAAGCVWKVAKISGSHAYNQARTTDWHDKAHRVDSCCHQTFGVTIFRPRRRRLPRHRMKNRVSDSSSESEDSEDEFDIRRKKNGRRTQWRHQNSRQQHRRFAGLPPHTSYQTPNGGGGGGGMVGMPFRRQPDDDNYTLMVDEHDLCLGQMSLSIDEKYRLQEQLMNEIRHQQSAQAAATAVSGLITPQQQHQQLQPLSPDLQDLATSHPMPNCILQDHRISAPPPATPQFQSRRHMVETNNNPTTMVSPIRGQLMNSNNCPSVRKMPSQSVRPLTVPPSPPVKVMSQQQADLNYENLMAATAPFQSPGEYLFRRIVWPPPPATNTQRVAAPQPSKPSMRKDKAASPQQAQSSWLSKIVQAATTGLGSKQKLRQTETPVATAAGECDSSSATEDDRDITGGAARDTPAAASPLLPSPWAPSSEEDLKEFVMKNHPKSAAAGAADQWLPSFSVASRPTRDNGSTVPRYNLDSAEALELADKIVSRSSASKASHNVREDNIAHRILRERCLELETQPVSFVLDNKRNVVVRGQIVKGGPTLKQDSRITDKIPLTPLRPKSVKDNHHRSSQSTIASPSFSPLPNEEYKREVLLKRGLQHAKPI